MKSASETLRIVIYQTDPAHTDRTSQRLTGMRHQIVACPSAKTLLHQALRDEPVDVVAIDCERAGRRVLDVVCSIAEVEEVPTLVLVDSFDSAAEELSAHAGVAMVRREASDAELRTRIGEALARHRTNREYTHRVDRLKARVRHEAEIALAKAHLMNELSLGEAQAYALLRRASQDRRVKLEEIARVVLSEGVRAVSERTRNSESVSSTPRALNR